MALLRPTTLGTVTLPLATRSVTAESISTVTLALGAVSITLPDSAETERGPYVLALVDLGPDRLICSGDVRLMPPGTKVVAAITRCAERSAFTRAAATAVIPPALWDDLKRDGLLRDDAPVAG